MPDPTSPQGWLTVAEQYLQNARACQPEGPGLTLLSLRACDAALKALLTSLGPCENPRSYGHDISRLVDRIEALGCDCSPIQADVEVIERAHYLTPNGEGSCHAKCEMYTSTLSDEESYTVARLVAAQNILDFARKRVEGRPES